MPPNGLLIINLLVPSFGVVDIAKRLGNSWKSLSEAEKKVCRSIIGPCINRYRHILTKLPSSLLESLLRLKSTMKA